MTGIEMLGEVRRQSPDAKLLLLTAYADTDVAITAINDIGLDYYLAQAVGPAGGAALPGRRRPARATGSDAHPDRDARTCGSWATGGPSRPRRQDVPRPQPRAVPLARRRARRGGAPAARPRRRRRRRPAARPRARRRRRSGRPRHRRARRRRSACAPAPSSRSTTSASSAAARPGSPPRCTPRPRGCRPSSSSATPRAARPARARRSRTTSASRGGCPAPTSPSGPSPRLAGSARRWCWPATWSASRPAGRCGRSSSAAAARSRPERVLVATGVSYRRLEAPGIDALAGPRRLLRRRRQPRRGQCDGRGRLRRRRGELRRPGGRSTSPATPAGSSLLVRGTSLEASMSQYLVERIRGRRAHRASGAAPRSSAAPATATSSG